MAMLRPHTGVCASDACKIDIGGYTESGIFWRFYLPEEWLGIFTLNILEYIVSIFTAKFEIADTTHPFLSIPTRLDSTTADAWMGKSSFDPDDTIHTECGRHLGLILVDNNTCLDFSWMQEKTTPSPTPSALTNIYQTHN